MGAYVNKELANNESLSSNDLTNFLEMVCAMFLRLISENDKDKYNYIVINLQEIIKKSYETFIEINGDEGVTKH